MLPDYIRGTLDSALVAGVQAHLRTCHACAAELETLREAFAALDGKRREEIPGGYFPSILPRVHQRLERKRKLSWMNGPFVNKVVLPLGVAAVLLVVLWHLPGTWEMTGSGNGLKTALTSASADDIAEILQENVTSQDVSSLNTIILTRALSDEQFVRRQLVHEALNSETTSPFDVIADVTPDQVLADLQEPDAEQALQQLEKMETP